jgi:hypothetical protein
MMSSAGIYEEFFGFGDRGNPSLLVYRFIGPREGFLRVL